MSAGILLLYLWSLLIFLLPGFALTMQLAARRAVRPTYAVILLFVCGSALGYLAFWIFFVNKVAGISFSFVVAVASLWLGLMAFADNPDSRRLLRQIALPLIYLAVAGACYLSFLFAVGDPFRIGPGLVNWRFFTTERPGDNLIPLTFADKIYNRQPLSPFCCGDWLSSDRPPLQTGILLLFWRLKLSGTAGLNYQLLGTALQCSWICAVWVLLTTLRVAKRHVTQVLGLMFPSAFLFYNSVYTWPKLLAATFILFAIAILLTGLEESRPLTTAELSLGACCIGLALMAHPGSVFSMPVFGVALLVRRNLPWRGLVWGTLILLCFALPWRFYQTYVDPPGNRLLKMHLAGAGGVDPRTTWQAIKDSYGSATWTQLLSYKWQNLTNLVGPEPIAGFGLKALPSTDAAALEDVRVVQREYIWSAIGILNLGWIAAGVVWFRQRKTAIPYAGWLLLAGLINLVLWSVLLFGPNQTVTTHSSYADILLIMLGLCGFLLSLPNWVAGAVTLLEALNVLLVWIQFRPIIPNFQTATQWPLLIVGVLLVIGLLSHALHASFIRDPE